MQCPKCGVGDFYQGITPIGGGSCVNRGCELFRGGTLNGDPIPEDTQPQGLPPWVDPEPIEKDDALLHRVTDLVAAGFPFADLPKTVYWLRGTSTEPGECFVVIWVGRFWTGGPAKEWGRWRNGRTPYDCVRAWADPPVKTRAHP